MSYLVKKNICIWIHEDDSTVRRKIDDTNIWIVNKFGLGFNIVVDSIKRYEEVLQKTKADFPGNFVQNINNMSSLTMVLISYVVIFLVLLFFDFINMLRKCEAKGFIQRCKFVFYGIDISKRSDGAAIIRSNWNDLWDKWKAINWAFLEKIKCKFYEQVQNQDCVNCATSFAWWCLKLCSLGNFSVDFASWINSSSESVKKWNP